MSDAKKKILARRAQFVAAAMAGTLAASCGKEARPRPCLEPMISPGPDAGPPDPPPQPCLDVALPRDK